MNDSELSRFMNKVEIVTESGCWLWTGGTKRKEYGCFHLNVNAKSQAAHRVSYEHFIGKIPDGLHIDHLCRVSCCVNPHHMEPVTTQENTRRGKLGEWQRIKTHCPKGHPYSGDNLVVYNGCRYCRICRKEIQKKSQ